MGNIVQLARSDLKRMFSNVMSIIIAIGLVVMPSIFAWYNILACWDVFENTGNLKVAVASNDEGYESELVPIKVNIGDQVIAELRANHQIDWMFTDADDAIDGAKSGRYYAAVVIPEDFSRDMLTFYADNGQRAQVIYYANEKKNAIAPKVTGQGADAISYQVNQVFAEKVSEISLVLASTVARYADDTGLSASMEAVSARIDELGEDVTEVAQALRLYGRVVDSSAGIAQSTGQLVGGIEQSAEAVDEAAAPGVAALRECASTLRSSAGSMQSQMQDALDALQEARTSLDSMLDHAASDATAAVADMRNEAARLQAQADVLEGAADQMDSLAEGLPADGAAAAEATARMLRSSAELMRGSSSNLTNAAAQLEKGIAEAADQRDAANASLAEASAKLQEAQQRFEQNVVPAAERVASHCEALASAVSGKVSALASDESGTGPMAAMQRAASTLAGASFDVGQMADQLEASAAEIADLSERIDAAIATNDPAALRDLMTSDIQALSTALAAPVKMDREAVFPVANFGSAMTPLYSTLALFIGSLLIMVAVRPKPCAAEMRKLRDVKPYQVFFGRFVMVALISLAQTTLMALGNMFFLQVQIEHPWLFMLCYWVAGLVFSFIIYAMVQAFANLGKAVAVIMLIVQVTGCGGSFPLQILPQFVQQLSPWLPATYVVDAMRSAMFGVLGNDYWMAMGMLLVFLVPAALIGLVLRKPLAKLMSWYLERVEESKLMA